MNDLNGKEIIGTFYENELQRTNQQEFRIEKVIKKKNTNCTSNDLKNVSHVDVSSFALKSNLASLKTEVDKLDVDKLQHVPNDLAKLSNVVKNNVSKKIVYNKLVTEVDNIDSTNFAEKTNMKKMDQILKIKSTR